MLERIVIVGTGLIGSSIGLALRRAGYSAALVGVDTNAAEGAEAVRRGAVDQAFSQTTAGLIQCRMADLVVLAVPVMGILDWMGKLSEHMLPGQVITDAGSTKALIAAQARQLFGEGRASFLPGHPMAGKEHGGAAQADGSLFDGAMWLWTPVHPAEGELEQEWRAWVRRFGARSMDLDPDRHDKVCAWVSHLPQMVSTAMSALFADEFSAQPELQEEFNAIGGRALREMTRLGSSPYSMWRDIAMTNDQNIQATLFALEQRLQHLRENLRTPELREEFRLANGFRQQS